MKIAGLIIAILLMATRPVFGLGNPRRLLCCLVLLGVMSVVCTLWFLTRLQMASYEMDGELASPHC